MPSSWRLDPVTGDIVAVESGTDKAKIDTVDVSELKLEVDNLTIVQTNNRTFSFFVGG